MVTFLKKISKQTGAGPSGLVTAKTLLYDHPNGTFAPVIFEQRHDIGGLWPNSPAVTTTHNKSDPTSHGQNESTVGPLNPFMRTNLSRFTVAFSDLAWESVVEDTEVPMFPQAWQVGKYLDKYAERFLPNGVLRLGRRVVRTSQKVGDGDGQGRQWGVQWVERFVLAPLLIRVSMVKLEKLTECLPWASTVAMKRMEIKR